MRRVSYRRRKAPIFSAAVAVAWMAVAGARADTPATTSAQLNRFDELRRKAATGTPADRTALAMVVWHGALPNAYTLGKAIALLHEAAAAGDPSALAMLARMHREGLRAHKDQELAAELEARLRSVLNASDRIEDVDCAALAAPRFAGASARHDLSPAAAYKLAWCQMDEGRRPPGAAQLALIERAADAGLADAQLAYGMLVEQGVGVDASSATASTYYKRASIAPASPAVRIEAAWQQLALEHTGLVPTDPEHFAVELVRVARAGHDRAMLLAAQLGVAGTLRTVTGAEIRAWVDGAVKAGYGVAHLLVAICLDHGIGSEPDAKRAAEAYAVAGSIGYGAAYARLAELQLSGALGKVDREAARASYAKAVEKGFDSAAEALRTLQ